LKSLGIDEATPNIHLFQWLPMNDEELAHHVVDLIEQSQTAAA
jgi:hypothetical protein